MNKTHAITIGDKNYEVDVEKAARDGYLKEIPDYPLQPGDVYAGLDGWNNLLLIETEYKGILYGLIGRSGLKTFSNVPTNVPLDKIKAYLAEKNFKFSHNINEKVRELIHQKPA